MNLIWHFKAKQTRGSLIARFHPAPASFGFRVAPLPICVQPSSSKLCPQVNRACVWCQTVVTVNQSFTFHLHGSCACALLCESGKSFVFVAQWQAGRRWQLSPGIPTPDTELVISRFNNDFTPAVSILCPPVDTIHLLRCVWVFFFFISLSTLLQFPFAIPMGRVEWW